MNEDETNVVIYQADLRMVIRDADTVIFTEQLEAANESVTD